MAPSGGNTPMKLPNGIIVGGNGAIREGTPTLVDDDPDAD
jgi:hypothetical protein